jgi:hypothetical protein
MVHAKRSMHAGLEKLDASALSTAFHAMTLKPNFRFSLVLKP